MEERELWQVEKFIPLNCPRCNHKFERQNDDYVIFFGDIIEESKIPRPTAGYDIIICQNCENYTARVWLRTQTVETLEEAQRLVATEGFVNIHEVVGFGTHAKPRVRVFNEQIVGPLRIHPHWPPEEDDWKAC